MKPVLCIQNVSLEKLGLMEKFLSKRNISFIIRDLYSNESVPSDPGGYGAVVVLGGPMSVNEEKEYPFLVEEKHFLTRCFDKKVPILGICLGAQLLAAATGAKVRKNERTEIGWMNVELTDEGIRSPLFKGLTSPMPVFQWHGETFELPNQAQWLASSIHCRNQAFSIEDRYFGLQFHMEVTLDIAAEWAEGYLPELSGADKQTALALLEKKNQSTAQAAAQVAERLFENFFVQVAEYR